MVVRVERGFDVAEREDRELVTGTVVDDEVVARDDALKVEVSCDPTSFGACDAAAAKEELGFDD
jgi:hypothetical protein